MSWSPEELVKQLRLPDRIHIGRLMRDAADMIERLQLAGAPHEEAQSAEIARLRGELTEARTDHATAYANTVTLAQECDALRAELANLAGRNLGNSLDRSKAEAALGRVRELCELAIRDRDSGVGIEDIVNAIERVEK